MCYNVDNCFRTHSKTSERDKVKERTRGKRIIAERNKSNSRCAKVLNEVRRMRETQDHRTAEMVNILVESYISRVRSLKERRAAAKIRELNRVENVTCG